MCTRNILVLVLVSFQTAPFQTLISRPPSLTGWSMKLLSKVRSGSREHPSFDRPFCIYFVVFDVPGQWQRLLHSPEQTQEIYLSFSWLLSKCTCRLESTKKRHQIRLDNGALKSGVLAGNQNATLHCNNTYDCLRVGCAAIQWQFSFIVTGQFRVVFFYLIWITVLSHELTE